MTSQAGAAGFAAGEPFLSCEEAWFWACRAIQARRNGAERRGYGVRRPCDPEDILLCAERLLRTGAITRSHARAMGVWGCRQTAPTAHLATSEDECLWTEAMNALGPALIKKGAVARSHSRY